MHMHVQCIRRKWTEDFIPEWNLTPKEETQLSSQVQMSSLSQKLKLN